MKIYLYEDLFKAQTETALLAATQKAVQAMGFDNFVYGYRRYDDQGGFKDHMLGTYPEAWMEQYAKQSYEYIDPCVHHCFNRQVPIVWEHELFKGGRNVWELHNESVDFGISGGACFPIHGARGKSWGLLGIANAQDTDKAKAQVLDVLEKGQFLANHLHEAAQRILGQGDSTAFQCGTLTDKELECLKWAAQGFGSKQIADKIGRTLDTVNFHIKNACRKLGITKRSEAVARAIAHGLIEP